MKFKPSLWYPIAVVLAAVNLVAMAFAAAMAEQWHAASHAGLAVAFGLWAQRLREGTVAPSLGDPARLDALEGDVANLRRELAEAQERIDFAERVLAQQAEQRRVEGEK